MRVPATVYAWTTLAGATIDAWTSQPIHSFLWVTYEGEGATVYAWSRNRLPADVS
jgi:hypothetical protein